MVSPICPRCAFARHSLPTRLIRRSFSTSRIARAGSTPTKTISPNASQTSTQSRSSPAATSSPGIAQPFSSPLIPSGATAEAAAAAAAAAAQIVKPAIPTSSVAAGKVLKGLNYHKNREDPVALPEDQYPIWLWSLLEPRSNETAAAQESKEMDPRLFAKSANVRRKANKRARAAEALRGGETAARQVPLHEQTVNLPEDETAAASRTELTRSMRSKRRRDIKEANFLKEMA